MAGPVNEEFNSLVKSLNESKYSKEESLEILNEYVNTLLSNKCITSDRLWATSMITGNYNKRVKINEWNFPHGFFGNWAKHSIEKKKGDIDEFDVDEMGC